MPRGADDISNSSFVQFYIWDFPGQVDFFDTVTFDTDIIFGGVGALVFVIDAQDDYLDALSKLNTTVTKAHSVNPKIKFEVFIHKGKFISNRPVNLGIIDLIVSRWTV